MKHFIFLLFICSSFIATVNGQEFNKSINKDSLFQTILEDFPIEKREELQKMYKEGNEQTKEFLLIIFSMPRSSKKKMIANIDSNLEKINLLKSSYLKLVPKNYVVSIEFDPANKVIMTNETIGLKITHTNNNQSTIKQEWNLEYNSPKLAEMIKPLGWTKETLTNIKKLLSDANCVSIENKETITIGFSRSGMGMYSLKLFDKDLTSERSRSTTMVVGIFFTKRISY